MTKAKVVGVMAGALMLMGFGAEMASAAPVETAAPASTVRIMTDGCTKVPDSFFGANFKPACDTHDRCYSRTSTTSRLNCDKRLFTDLTKACTSKFGKFNPLRYECVKMAGVYYTGVRNLARSHYHGKGDPT
ncbi:phospholipase A2 [Amycolatopsis sp. cg5]|uniref:phospholipase A2 n=1 Tax=Amycolatopsis sp. cg5 TaxID=3238802 RepID=UPI0035234B4E